jgi:MFS-type transporter involved in bile tolerance (Atg22 family)
MTGLFQSQRAGMATVIVFLAVGLLLLLPVREEK